MYSHAVRLLVLLLAEHERGQCKVWQDVGPPVVLCNHRTSKLPTGLRNLVTLVVETSQDKGVVVTVFRTAVSDILWRES